MKLVRVFNLLVALVLAVSTIASYRPAAAQSKPAAPAPANAQFVPGEVVVGLAPNPAPGQYLAQADALAGTFGAQVMQQQDNLVLLSFAAGADVKALAGKLKSRSGVAFAEPNYIYSLPKPPADKIKTSDFQKNFVLRRSEGAKQPAPAGASGKVPFRVAAGGKRGGAPAPNGQRMGGEPEGGRLTRSDSAGKPLTAIPIASLQAAKATGGPKAKALYPTDPYVWWGGWDWVGASIVWPNTTASAGICELDTGVDYLHPDLSKNIVKGYDYVNDDADPMDDNGHGTHVAGIMVAMQNNLIGIAGVSNGKVVAYKVLDAEGWGTNMDVAMAINACAARTDVKVINLSLGGPASTAINSAIDNAVNTKNMLIVAAAGNDDTNVTTDAYPAAYSTTFPNKVLAVAASGFWYQPDPVGTPDDWEVDYSCAAGGYDQTPKHWTNYGSWVNVVAPGTDITSTTPWDKPFWLNTADGVPTRYSSLDGTSMAAPYVAATAARRWGYKPTRTNAQIGADVIASGDVTPSSHTGEFDVDTTNHSGDSDPGVAELGQCWDPSMAGASAARPGNAKHANVAAMLDRGAVAAQAFDAQTGSPLNGATIQAYHGTYSASVLVGSAVITPDTSKACADCKDPARIYTDYNYQTDIINLPLDAYHGAGGSICQGQYDTATFENLNKAGYTASAQWLDSHTCIAPGVWSGFVRALVPPKSANFDVVAGWYLNFDQVDLDELLWLPSCGSPPCGNQLSNFLISPEGKPDEGNDNGTREGDTAGNMTVFPFARSKHDGGQDGSWMRVEDITIHNRLAHDGLLANAALPYYPGTYTVNLTDWHFTSGGTDPAVLGTINADSPWVFVWKDGLLKSESFNDDTCSDHYWKAMTITSGASGAVSYWPAMGAPDYFESSECAGSVYGP